MAGEGDIFASTATGAADGSVVPGIGTGLGAAMGLASGVMKYFGGLAQSDAMRAQALEELRRKQLRDAQQLGQATSAGGASGVEFGSGSLQSYLGAMKTEMLRQQQWQSQAASTNAGNVSTAAGFGLFADVGSSLYGYAKDNNYWRKA